MIRLFLLILLPIGLFARPHHLLAQSQHEQYITLYSAYRDAHESYRTARNAYLQFDTLKSKTDAETATKTMLILRSETLLAYLRLLLEKIGTRDETNSTTIDILDQDIVWYRTNLDTVKQSSTLSEIVSVSERFEERYEKTTIKYLSVTINMINFRFLGSYNDKITSALARYQDSIFTLPGNRPKSKLQKDLADAQNTYLNATEELQIARSLIKSHELVSADSFSQEVLTHQQTARALYIKTFSYLSEIEKEISQY